MYVDLIDTFIHFTFGNVCRFNDQIKRDFVFDFDDEMPREIVSGVCEKRPMYL